MSSFRQGPRGPSGGHRGYPQGPRDPGGRGGSGQRPRKSIPDFWPGYLEGGYFNEQGHLRIEYVSRERVEILVQEICRDRPLLTPHQVRRYFGHCRALETRLRTGGAAWEDVLPEVKKLEIAAADGYHKQQPKIPELFYEFIRRNVDKIKTRKDFLQGFLPHFEAFVGFGQVYLDKVRN